MCPAEELAKVGFSFGYGSCFVENISIKEEDLVRSKTKRAWTPSTDIERLGLRENRRQFITFSPVIEKPGFELTLIDVWGIAREGNCCLFQQLPPNFAFRREHKPFARIPHMHFCIFCAGG